MMLLASVWILYGVLEWGTWIVEGTYDRSGRIPFVDLILLIILAPLLEARWQWEKYKARRLKDSHNDAWLDTSSTEEPDHHR